MAKLTTKQGIERVLTRLEKIDVTIEECEKRLSKIKPIDFHQNEITEVLKQILENQYRLSKMISYVIKYVNK